MLGFNFLTFSNLLRPTVYERIKRTVHLCMHKKHKPRVVQQKRARYLTNIHMCVCVCVFVCLCVCVCVCVCVNSLGHVFVYCRTVA